MDYLNKINNALLGPAGKSIPPAVETIQKITDRLTQSSLLSDRRAAVLSLKSLTRDWKAAVGENSLDALIAVLDVDAKEDPDIGKACLETLLALCECDDVDDQGNKKPVAKDDVGLKHTDHLLQTPNPIHTILYLLTQPHFYVRFTSVQLLTALVANRPQIVQQHFLTDPDGPSSIVAIISEKREIIRNEALLLTQNLVRGNIDIGKSLAFGGIFEKLIQIISSENGVEGGIVAQDCLYILDGLLQYNTSNQSYFRELGLPSALPQLLLYPSPPPARDEPSPQGFSLQFWDAQKTTNALIVMGMIATLSRGKGISQKSLEQHGITRCLIDLALSSNAPTSLKTQALLALSPFADLATQVVTVYIPVPESNGEEWDRLPEESALSALVGVALEGEYAGVMGAGTTQQGKGAVEGLYFRCVAAGVFESYLYANDGLRLVLLQDLAQADNQNKILDESSSSLRIVRVLGEPPVSPLSTLASLRHVFACTLLSSLIRASEQCKSAAKAILPAKLLANFPSTPLNASRGPSPAPPPIAPPALHTMASPEDDEDPPQSLLAHLVGSLALIFRSRSLVREQSSSSPNEGEEQVDSNAIMAEITEWDRVLVAYLSLLSVWCWDYEKGVKEVLEEGGLLGLIVEPVAQNGDVDILVQGISAFLLGVCYEFNREQGEVGRQTLHTIIHSRISLDHFTSSLARLRSDARFKSISAESPIVFFDSEGYEVPPTNPGARPSVWLDWGFVEFWKGNSYAIQKAVAADPNAMPTVREVDPETEALVASYKDIIRQQAQEMQKLQAKVDELTEELAKPEPPPPPPPAPVESPKAPSPPPIAPQIAQLQSRIDDLESELAKEQAAKKAVEKEQEDLLVLLDDLNEKRAKDKTAMREKGMEVSEDEEDDDDDDDEDDEDDDDEEEE